MVAHGERADRSDLDVEKLINFRNIGHVVVKKLKAYHRRTVQPAVTGKNGTAVNVGIGNLRSPGQERSTNLTVRIGADRYGVVLFHAHNCGARDKVPLVSNISKFL